MEAIKYVQFFSKLGYIFANCDGNFDPQEKAYIDNYISFLVAKQVISHNEDETILKQDNSSITIDDVIKELKVELEKCDNENRTAIVNTFTTFIEEVIGVDGVIAMEEKTLYDYWISAIK